MHTAPTTDKNSWLNRPRWSARYFVLRYGHWFWFRDEKALLTGGLSACLGSISLLLNPFTIDLHPKYTTRFFIRFGDWYSVQIDTSIERKDRGEWALLFLASGNLVSKAFSTDGKKEVSAQCSCAGMVSDCSQLAREPVG